jgi:hypothetical protein
MCSARECRRSSRFSTIALLALGVLSGCARPYDLYLMGRSSGDQARTTIERTAQPGGDFAVLLHGKQYVGRWVYMENAGAVTNGAATGVSGGQVATANGVALSAPRQGGGSVIAAAADGSTLHCQYTFDSWSRSGVGVCQDNRGELYDLQITQADWL